NHRLECGWSNVEVRREYKVIGKPAQTEGLCNSLLVRPPVISPAHIPDSSCLPRYALHLRSLHIRPGRYHGSPGRCRNPHRTSTQMKSFASALCLLFACAALHAQTTLWQPSPSHTQ